MPRQSFTMKRDAGPPSRSEHPMLSKNDILDSILTECDIATHVVSKIPADGADYRQSPDQRSNLEIARYLAFCAIGGTCAMIDGNWDRYTKWNEATANVELANFAEAMERQKQALRDTFDALDDDDLQREVAHPLGHTMRLERAFVELPLKWLVAYRMQVFTGAKAAGNSDLWTPDCWGGITMERPTAAS